MINKLSSLLTSNVNFDSVIEFILRVIYNRPETQRTYRTFTVRKASCYGKRGEKETYKNLTVTT